jgi:hypothetical protein
MMYGASQMASGEITNIQVGVKTQSDANLQEQLKQMELL